MIYRKTLKGSEEIKAKKGALDRRLRPLLILVDGHRSTQVIVALATGIGVEATALKQLEVAGYIEMLPVANTVEQRVAAPAGPVTVAPHTLAPAGPATVGRLEAPQPRTRFERFRDGQQYMNETVSDVLGVRALFFVLKIEKCANALELLNLLPDFEEAVAKKRGPQYASHCRLIAAEILSS